MSRAAFEDSGCGFPKMGELVLFRAVSMARSKRLPRDGEVCVASLAGGSIFPGLGSVHCAVWPLWSATAVFPEVGRHAWFRTPFVAKGSPHTVPHGL